MSMFKSFKTDTSLEQKGVVIEYDDFRVTIARSGGSNKKYAKALEAKTRPIRRAIETDTLGEERGRAILHEVFAEAVVLNWETRIGIEEDDWEVGIESPEGGILPFTKENVIKTFQLLPDLFQDLQAQSNKISLFRGQDQEDAAGN